MNTIEKQSNSLMLKILGKYWQRNADVDLNVLFIEKFDEEHRKLEIEIKNIIFLKICR